MAKLAYMPFRAAVCAEISSEISGQNISRSLDCVFGAFGDKPSCCMFDVLPLRTGTVYQTC